jgi:hypothetical protein
MALEDEVKKVSQNKRTQQQLDGVQNWAVFTHIGKEAKFLNNTFKKTKLKVAYRTQLPLMLCSVSSVTTNVLSP